MPKTFSHLYQGGPNLFFPWVKNNFSVRPKGQEIHSDTIFKNLTNFCHLKTNYTEIKNVHSICSNMLLTCAHITTELRIILILLLQ